MMRSVYEKQGGRTGRKASMALKIEGGNAGCVTEGLFHGTLYILFKSLGFIVSVEGSPRRTLKRSSVIRWHVFENYTGYDMQN